MGKDLSRHLSKKRHGGQISNVKRCSTSYIINELHIKTIMRYHYMHIRKAEIHNTDSTNTGEDVEQKDLSFIAGKNAKWYSHFGTVLFLAKLNILLPWDPAVMLLGYLSTCAKT